MFELLLTREGTILAVDGTAEAGGGVTVGVGFWGCFCFSAATGLGLALVVLLEGFSSATGDAFLRLPAVSRLGRPDDVAFGLTGVWTGIGSSGTISIIESSGTISTSPPSSESSIIISESKLRGSTAGVVVALLALSLPCPSSKRDDKLIYILNVTLILLSKVYKEFSFSLTFCQNCWNYPFPSLFLLVFIAN